MELALSGADAKTLMLARQILECDQMLSGNLNQINDLNDLRGLYAERKQEVALLKAFVREHGINGTISAEAFAKHWPQFVANNSDLAEKYDLIPMPAAWSPYEKPMTEEFIDPETEMVDQDKYDAAIRDWEDSIARDPNYSQDVSDAAYMNGKAIFAKQSHGGQNGVVQTSYDGMLAPDGAMSSDTLDAELERQDTAIQKFDQAKELINIRNQQSLQLKQRTLTLVSNFNQADHEGQKAVISNTRG
ncbi:MAG: hypothetical protein JRH20_26810 [Deltaproteobacteria bacterium]|nr:hypothetical protein [Deltaproteobacteria bacterium]